MIGALAMLAGCATTPHGLGKGADAGPEGTASGQWHGKALVRNLQNGKSGTLSLDIVAQEPSRLRMEVTAMLGIYVASFAMHENEVQYIIAQQKKFVTAPADENALHDLMPIRISPQDFERILFDRDLPAKSWSCGKDKIGQLLACSHAGDDGVRLTWLERNGGHRKFKIESPIAEATLVLDESRPKVEPKADAFQLSAPMGYRQEFRSAGHL